MRPFWDSMLGIFSAVPDLSFSFTSIEEVKPGIVLIENYIGAGHHTGNSMEFPPHPPIPPTGAYIADDPIHVTLKIRHGKVMDVHADTGGGVAGPPGFYAKAKYAYDKSRKQ